MLVSLTRTLGSYIEMYMQMYNTMCHMDIWENFLTATKPIIFVIKRTALVPGVSPFIRIRSMMHYVHTGEVVVTSIKISFFLIVTTRTVANSGRFVYIQICVGEFGKDAGQPLVTSYQPNVNLPECPPQGTLHLH